MISCYPLPTNNTAVFDLCRMVPSNRLVYVVRSPKIGNKNNFALSICRGKLSSAVHASSDELATENRVPTVEML